MTHVQAKYDDMNLPAAGLQGILASLPQAVFVLDKSAAAILWQNDAARQMRTAAGSVPLISPGTALADAIELAIGRGMATTLRDHDFLGQACRAVSIYPHDDFVIITALQENLQDRSAQSSAALRPAALMARVLAHEIKNPLAGIQAAGQLLAKQSGSNELTDLIVREALRIGRLVDRVMVFADDVPVSLMPLNLHAPCEQAIDSVTAATPLTVVRRLDPSLPDILGDHDGLVQVFMNLCQNAIEAGATQLTLSSSYLNVGAPVDKVRQLKLPIALRIEDNGSGMDAETTQRLFEAYYTTKGHGHGLGLAIVAKIINDHGGQISVDSAVGRSVFTLYFPLAQGSEPS